MGHSSQYGPFMDSINEISNRFVEDRVRLSPMTATELGHDVRQDELDDFSPDGLSALHETVKRSLAAARSAELHGPGDESAAATFIERNQLHSEMFEAGLGHANLNVIASPVQEVRQIFDMMATETDDDWALIARRMAAVPQALAGYRRSLVHGADHGVVSAVRQIAKCAEQCDTWAGVTGNTPFFHDLAARAGRDGALGETLSSGATAASEAYGQLGAFLRNDLAPRAPHRDAVGEQTYRLQSRYFTGATLDLQESYDWAWEEFAGIEAEMQRVAGRLRPGMSLAETAESLDADPAYRITSQAALRDWMQSLSDGAVAAVRDVHFDIPDEIITLECHIAPPGGGLGAYYNPPSDDLSRPGSMWWKVMADSNDFASWRETTTVYHEGVPGHHLQMATQVYAKDTLNDFQRLMSFTSGHGEGWALYAERLMLELGFLDDDGDLLGLLDSQLFRTARVIIDIGMHLELVIPRGSGFHPGERWTPDLGLEFLLTRTLSEPQHARDEVDRYLGWAGQAPAYKLGERVWLAARAEAMARHGAGFDLRAFHTAALNLGGMGLDPLVDQLAKL